MYVTRIVINFCNFRVSRTLLREILTSNIILPGIDAIDDPVSIYYSLLLNVFHGNYSQGIIDIQYHYLLVQDTLNGLIMLLLENTQV